MKPTERKRWLDSAEIIQIQVKLGGRQAAVKVDTGQVKPTKCHECLGVHLPGWALGAGAHF